MFPIPSRIRVTKKLNKTGRHQFSKDTFYFIFWIFVISPSCRSYCYFYSVRPKNSPGNVGKLNSIRFLGEFLKNFESEQFFRLYVELILRMICKDLDKILFSTSEFLAKLEGDIFQNRFPFTIKGRIMTSPWFFFLVENVYHFSRNHFLKIFFRTDKIYSRKKN